VAPGENNVRPSEHSGKSLGPYRVLGEIGRGGMGVVLKAHDPALDRSVALKVLSPQLAKDDNFMKRFMLEARAIAKLDHPGIVQVYQVSEDKDTVFIAMQFVHGQPLSAIIDEKGKLT